MSAVPVRENVKRLVDLMPEHELRTVERMLRGLVAASANPFLAALANAPEDDEPVSGEEEEAVRLSEEDEARGELISDADLWRELGHAPRR